jgi:putative MATE family efflux protein
VNVVCNYLLIHGNLGFPALGIRGAAIATVLGTVVACGMSIASLFHKDSFVSVPYMLEENLFATKRALKDITSFASNICVEQLMIRVGFMISTMLVANLGTQSLAAHQVGMNAMHLSFAFGEGLQVAAVTLIGQSLGQNNPELAKKFGKICQGVGLCISVCLSVIYLICGEYIFYIFFPNDPELVEIGVMIMKMMIIVVLCQISQVVYMGSLRGAGDVRYTTATSTLSITIFRPGISYIAAYVLHMGVLGIWIGIFGDQLMRLILTALRFKSGKWMTKKI